MGTYIYKMPDIEEDPIADAMTDKATIELTSPVDGVVTALGCEAGERLAVGAALANFAVEDEEPEAASNPKIEKETPSKIEPQRTPPTKVPSLKTNSTPNLLGGDKKPLASPAVRKRAREMGLNLSDAVPTGASGQVTHIDLDHLEQTLQPAEGETRIKIIGLRRVIAERMQAAKRHIPHFTYVDEIDVTDLEALRKRANENARQNKSGAGKPKLTVLPFIIRALGITLNDWPQFNARYMDEQGFVSQFAALNLGLATMTDKGLIVPVIKDAGRKSIWQLARDIAKLEMRGGEVIERQVMNFSVSCDHRVIDGYDAAAMVQDLKKLLENPEAMFL